MKLVFGDLLAIDEGIILHQVNTKGIMGKGIASFLDKKYPGLEKDTKKAIALTEFNTGYDMVGNVHLYHATDKLTIGNCFSEIGMCSNRKPGDPANTSYDAVIKCFNIVKAINTELSPVYIPFKYGCGLAGGNWRILIEILKDYDFTVVARNVDYEQWINEQFCKQ